MATHTLHTLLRQAEMARILSLPANQHQALIDACSVLGFTCLRVDFSNTSAINDALCILGQALDFPDWYGANFDALHDCLLDFSPQDAPGCVITVANAQTLANTAPEAFRTLNAVFSESIADKSAQGVPFWIIYDNPVKGIPELADPS